MKANILYSVVLFLAISVSPADAGLRGSIIPEKTGLNFTQNLGQVTGFDQKRHPEVKFHATQKGVDIFLLETGLAYQFRRVYSAPAKKFSPLSKKSDEATEIQKANEQMRTETYRTDLVLVNANKNARITSEGMSDDYENYYNHDVLNVHSYSKVTYHEVYPGIDWVIYSAGGILKYDFVVHPGADPSQIRITFSHFSDWKINREGSFELSTDLGSITEQHPVSLQDNKPVRTDFQLSNNELSFNISNYDQTKELVIDPAVTWATYYGGNATDEANGVDLDASGNVYMTGRTTSAGNIASGGYQNTYGGSTDGYIVKFDAAGNRLWATYYGGSALDFGYFLCVDPLGDIYIAGTSASSSGISSNGHQNSFGGYNDAFLLKMNSAGTRLWATYYGGTGDDSGAGCTVDNNGDVYLCGTTKSTANIASGGHLNSQSGAYNAFLVKFSSGGVRQWGTYYGITGSTYGNACITDASGNVFLCGETDYATDIASNGHQNTVGGTSSFQSDGFLAKFNSAGVRQWGTYYGGDSYDQIMACVTDAAGNVFAVGGSLSEDNIATPGSPQDSHWGAFDCFAVKFSSSGVRQWGTYYGYFDQETFYGADMDAAGNLYAVGYMEYVQDNYDFIVAKISSSGTFIWTAQYGDSGFEFGKAIATDGMDTYVCGTTESHSGIASGGFQNTFGGGNNDACLIKFGCFAVTPNVTVGKQEYCVGDMAKVTGPAAYSYTWHTGASGSVLQFIVTESNQYTYNFQDAQKCPGQGDFNISVIECTGLSEWKNAGSWYVSPNPTSGKISISSSSEVPYEIYDYTGKKLVSGKLSVGSNAVDLSGYAPGLYFIRSADDQQSVILTGR